MEMSSRIFWQVDPPHPSLQSIVCVWPPPGTHARRAGEGHWGHQPQVQPSGCPGPTPLLSGNLQSLLPFVPLRFQFQWRLMVARLCLRKFRAKTERRTTECRIEVQTVHCTVHTVCTVLYILIFMASDWICWVFYLWPRIWTTLLNFFQHMKYLTFSLTIKNSPSVGKNYMCTAGPPCPYRSSQKTRNAE